MCADELGGSNMIEIGRVVTKIAGRDAGKKGVIVDIIDDHYVLIDGETRRRKVNLAHLEPHDEVVKLSKGASPESAAKALGIEPRKSKPKKAAERPKKQRGKAAPKKE